MKKVILYKELINDAIEKIEAHVVVNPISKEKIYLFVDDGYSFAYNSHDLQYNLYWLSKNDLIKSVEKERKKESLFLDNCIAFHKMCMDLDRDNPFIEIGKNEIIKWNSKVLDLSDNVLLSSFIKSNFHISVNISEFYLTLIGKLDIEQ